MVIVMDMIIQIIKDIHMKKIIFLLASVIVLSVTACSEDVNIDIPEDYENAEITGISVYNEDIAFVESKASIDKEAKSVTVTLAQVQDITRLKVTLTISPGSTVITPLGTGLLDFSTSKTLTIASPGKTVQNEWTIAIINP
jgi:hypothetical protein